MTPFSQLFSKSDNLVFVNKKPVKTMKPLFARKSLMKFPKALIGC